MKSKDFYKILVERRSIRKFHENKKIPYEAIERILKAASFAPIACNLQPVEFLLFTEEKAKKKLFPLLKWAANLDDYAPKPGERPTAFVLALINKDLVPKAKFTKEILKEAYLISLGCAVSNLTNQAYAEGVSSCIIGAIDKDGVRKEFNIDKKYSVKLVIALGYAKESPIVEIISTGKKPTYYKNEKGDLVVQKKLNFEVF